MQPGNKFGFLLALLLLASAGMSLQGVHAGVLAVQESEREAADETHRSKVRDWFRRAMEAELAGDFSEALRLHRTISDYLETGRLVNHKLFEKDYLNSVSNQARNCEEIGDCEQAIATRQKLMTHLRHSPEHAGQLRFNEGLCEKLRQQANLPEAQRRKLGRGVYHLFAAGVMVRKASTVSGAGDHARQQDLLAKSNSHFQQAVDIYVAFDPEDVRIGICNFRMGQNYRNLRQYRRSNECFEIAHQRYASDLGPSHTSTILALSYIGRNFTDLGLFEEAVEQFRSCIAAVHAEGGSGNANTNLGYYHLAVAEALAHQYRFVEARLEIEAATEVLEKQRSLVRNYQTTLIRGRRDIATGWNMLSTAAIELGDLELALEMNNRSLEMHRTIQADNIPLAPQQVLDNEAAFAHCLRNRGRILLDTGKPGEAIPVLDEAEKRYGEKIQEVISRANVLKFRAIARSKQGDYAEAVHDARAAIDLQSRDRIASNLPPALWSSHLALAEIHRHAGQNREALEVLKLVQAQYEGDNVEPDDIERADLYEQFGKTYAALADRDNAFACFSRTIQWRLQHIEDHVLALNENDASRHIRQFHELLWQLLRETDLTDPEKRMESYRHVFRIKGLVSRIMRQQSEILNSLNESGEATVDELRSVRRRLSRTILLNQILGERVGDKENRDRVLASTGQLNRQYERVVGKLVQGELPAVPVQLNGSLDTLIRHLPEAVAIVDVVSVRDPESPQVDARYVVYVLGQKDGEPDLRAVALDGAAEIDGQARSLLTGLDVTGDTRDIRRAERTTETGLAVSLAFLSERVWKPVRSLIGDRKHVVFCAEGMLASLPWAVLPGENGRPYLVEDYSFTTASDCQTLLRLLGRPEAAGGSGFLAVGGLDYDQGHRRGLQLENLNTSQQELDEVKKILPAEMEFRSLTGDQAHAADLLLAIQDKRYVLLSTHGLCYANPFISETDNLLSLSAVALSGANRFGQRLADGNDAESGQLLTGTEILNSDLSQVELVVASACRTGSGQLQYGEGMLGIQRAMMWAGARSTLTSRWNLSDRHASAFTVSFFDELLNRQADKSQALRTAQLKMIREKVHPSAWATWTLSGDWRKRTR